ncbi:hypothetical protein NKI38_04520 [Mesorhizobium sp. M0621]|uniref:hypothetical protein n=1 Tax=Mesorhizobium sp. M0621 TaxID=2956974 RepID=UPI00333A3145
MTHTNHIYKRCKPVTNKNIGKNLLKGGKKEYPTAGAKELARAAKRQANKPAS